MNGSETVRKGIMKEHHLADLESALGYTFANRALLERALTHSSYYKSEKGRREPQDNERMEFLGDAVLELCVSEELFHRFPHMQEGQLSKTRARIVCETALFEAAKGVKLGEYLLLGHGEDLGGGREKPSILSDAFEATIAGIYLDGGWEPAKAFIHRSVLPLLDFSAHPTLEKDHKTRLQELVHQKTHGKQVVYQMLDQKGPDHQKVFTMAVLLDGKALGTGEGNSKQSAGQAAAADALRKMGESV